MHLKSLTLKGFKSFASATTLAFEPGITAIVGPNGSGKSNVVDALAWVMGEQGAKSLRGAKMEDVIFAGTAGKAPLGRAEVALTIDNTDGSLPIEYTEVTISRTLFRSGGSDYAINGTPCRLLDVQDLLSDTGMGSKMHVIVGQGQLDQILQAGPEQRRAFVEEAAGVLKHRRRKDKALRKLDSTQANVDRLTDLVAEIRRQLKPLGRQATIARKAAFIQAEVRDARARLLADDLVAATLAVESDQALKAERERLMAQAQRAVADAEAAHTQAEARYAATTPLVNQTQETWYGLAGVAERVRTTLSISAERVRIAEQQPTLSFKDPKHLDDQADAVEIQERERQEQMQAADEVLKAAVAQREEAEASAAQAERAYAVALRAVADRREGLAKLQGQVNSLTSRLDASGEEVARLETRREAAEQTASEAERAYASLESRLTGATHDELGLDKAWEDAEEQVEQAEAKLADLEGQVQAARERLGIVQARIEALSVGRARNDAAQHLVESAFDGVIDTVAALVDVDEPWVSAIAAALGPHAEAIAVASLAHAVQAVEHLKSEELGRATMIVGSEGNVEAPRPVTVGQWAPDVVRCPDKVRPAIRYLLRDVILVETFAQAREAAEQGWTAITPAADVVSRYVTSGGSDHQQSLIEIESAIDRAREEAEETERLRDQLTFEVAAARHAFEQAQQASAIALEALNASDAQMAALAEELSSLNQTAKSARDEIRRLEQAIQTAHTNREADQQRLADLTERLEAAESEGEVAEPDSEARDRAEIAARQARSAEMEARLALRSAEERARALAGRAESLRRAARAERDKQMKAHAKAERTKREAAVAAQVHQAATWLAGLVEQAQAVATAERQQAQAARDEAHRDVDTHKVAVRRATSALDELVQASHAQQLGRIETQMRLEQLHEKASGMGMSPEILMDEYGPDTMIPVLSASADQGGEEDAEPEMVPFVRTEQEKRLASAERQLAALGKINPLALEEFEALNQRHQFLAEQLEDVKKTRKDLLHIIDDIDQRVQDVFAAAYADIEQSFADVFATLFPGGEGRLLLTDPDDMLTTGIEVEARPAGKKVKRLSLLSGGERSLVAVAFLVSLFMARPSPFYILDEVEAALDDVNLGRLLTIFSELGQRSQLLIITHQKRTMEIAESLYGVTMRGDGVSTVISQKLEREQP